MRLSLFLFGRITVLTVADVAERLGVSISLVYELVSQKLIACYRVGSGRGTIRFAEADIDAYLQSRKQSVPGAPVAKPRKRPPASGWF